MFSGCGGSSQGIEAAGIPVWWAANHNEKAITTHEENHPQAEHFIADLVDESRKDYFHPEQLPAAEILWASPSCTENSKANAQRTYRRNLSLFDAAVDDDYEDRVTHSERSRATAVSVLQYARKHRPVLIAVENTVEFSQWGVEVPGKRKGDGSTFQWWLNEFKLLGYSHKVLMLNSMFFQPCPQSRDRMYVCFWHESVKAPDLDFRPEGRCDKCDTIVEARQVFKPMTKAWPHPNWGKYGDQYIYVCESCGGRVKPFAMPSASIIDWSDLGTRIGDKERPLAASTMARIARGVEKMSAWPSFIMPAKALSRGSDRHITEPLAAQTTQQEQMLVNAMQIVVAGNTFERDGSSCRTRSMAEPGWTQHGTASYAMVSNPFVTNRTNNVPGSVDGPINPFGTGGSHMLVSGGIDNFQGLPRSFADQLHTQPGGETAGLIAIPLLHTERGTGTTAVPRPARLDSMGDPMSAVAAGGNHHFMLTPVFAKQNGGPLDTAWHQVTDPFNTLTSADTTCLLVPPWQEMPPISVEDCMYRMLKPTEIKLGMGFLWDFIIRGSARTQVQQLGNAVTPPVSQWIMGQMVDSIR